MWSLLAETLLSRVKEPMLSCRRFLAGIPHLTVDHPRVTHPSATPCVRKHRTFDLHVLGTPPAFILSQDQTRHPVFLYKSLNGDLCFCLMASLLLSPFQVTSKSLTGCYCTLIVFLPLFSCSRATLCFRILRASQLPVWRKWNNITAHAACQ